MIQKALHREVKAVSAAILSNMHLNSLVTVTITLRDGLARLLTNGHSTV